MQSESVDHVCVLGLNALRWKSNAVTENECFTVVWAVQLLRYLVEETLFKAQADKNLKWILIYITTKERMRRWRPCLCKLNHEVSYHPVLVHQELDALRELLYPPDTWVKKLVCDDIFCFEARSTAFRQRLINEKRPASTFMENSFKTVNALTRSQSAIQLPVDNNLDNVFNPSH